MPRLFATTQSARFFLAVFAFRLKKWNKRSKSSFRVLHQYIVSILSFCFFLNSTSNVEYNWICFLLKEQKWQRSSQVNKANKSSFPCKSFFFSTVSVTGFIVVYGDRWATRTTPENKVYSICAFDGLSMQCIEFDKGRSSNDGIC